MKNISISKFSLVLISSVLLAACMGGGDYRTEVSNESYKEDYQMTQPMMAESTMGQPSAEMQKVSREAVNPTPAVTSSKNIRIVAPTAKQAELKRFGYTIQVIAMDSDKNAMAFANQLPNSQPVWQHYKKVNGTDWYSLLYGDYPTKSEAKAAIKTLPRYFQERKPFVKSIDELKDSGYPQLKMLR